MDICRNFKKVISGRICSIRRPGYAGLYFNGADIIARKQDGMPKRGRKLKKGAGK